eukprot:4494089-Lingulodinium_polyedra.AAC.1
MQDRVREWLRLLREYEQTLPVGQSLPEEVKVATLQAGCTGKLRYHIQLNPDAFHTLDQLVAFIDSYWDAQRAYRPAEPRAAQAAASNPDAMQVDAALGGKGGKKGKKGKGDGKGGKNAKGGK